MLPCQQCSGNRLRNVVGFVVGVLGVYGLVAGTAVPVKADIQFNVLYQNIGQFEFFAEGVGTRGNPDTGEWTGAGDITIALPDTAVIQKARLIWSGRSNHYDLDGVQLQVDLGTLNTITATMQLAQDPWCCNNAQQRHESADITALIQPGTHVYHISDHEHGVVSTGNYLNYGVGIWVVYEDASATVGEVIINEGQDSFFRLWTPPRGPHTQVNCVDFAADTAERTVEMTHMVSGVDTAIDIRSNAFWYMTGNGAQPAPDELPGLMGQPEAIGYVPPGGGYPFQSYAELEWDNFTIAQGIVIPVGANWICFQVESGDSTNLAGLGNVGTEASGMWDLFAVKIIAAAPTAVSLVDYSVEHVSVNEVELRWETAMEVDHVGFNLYRGETADFVDAEPIHFEPAAVTGGSRTGAIYRYTDTEVTDGQWWYWLESVDTTGQKEVEGVLMVEVPRFYEMFLPFVRR